MKTKLVSLAGAIFLGLFLFDTLRIVYITATRELVVGEVVSLREDSYQSEAGGPTTCYHPTVRFENQGRSELAEDANCYVRKYDRGEKLEYFLESDGQILRNSIYHLALRPILLLGFGFTLLLIARSLRPELEFTHRGG